MSGDKRSVSTDALETLGSVIDEHAGRDAIHVAVEPVEAQETLYPGQHVSRFGYSNPPVDRVGIVDPFLSGPVFKGQHFWLLVYPRTITSLRHVWSHPAFEDGPEPVAEPAPDKAASEAWLREFCDRCVDFATYDEIIQVASGTDVRRNEDAGGYYYGLINEGDYILSQGRDASGEIPPEFWTHLEIVTGLKITTRPTHFSCSC